MKNLKGLKVSVNQMPVIPGRLDINATHIIAAIKEAAKNGVDIIAFPEMGVSGYLIGDLYEDDSFVQDIARCNRLIVKSVPAGMTAIFGTLLLDPEKKGEDGRQRKSNGALIINNGKVSAVTKTLQPNYRMFDDERHFFSTRKMAERAFVDVADCLKPTQIVTRIGVISVGVILCEDMWKDDYNNDPTCILVAKGADIIFNLSASPWTWQKNRKRHQVVRSLLAKSPAPFVYVNNVGTQNNGKNIIAFDGSSTIYDKNGNIVMAVPPYAEGNHEFIFPDCSEDTALEEEKIIEMTLAEKIKAEAGELYSGWECAVRGAFNNLPASMRKAVIGLSGGIDSAVDAALMVKILGKENVYLINMPSQYNSQETKDIAKQIADNLGAHYEVRPIGEIVAAICEATGTVEDSLSYENIQARVRQEILAARCQDLGAVFVCNSNKIEMAFGYGTLYGDIAGFIAPLGDMLKYEVYQMGDYLNRSVFEREVIPEECFRIQPSAELKTAQKDPFHYGNLERRGYHDELVRAFVEFRKNPEWVLEKYYRDTLENELRLEPGTIRTLFLTHADFVADLEKNYRSFINSYFKRVQCPPVPILSKRSFGYDLRESMLSPYFTARYYDLKNLVLAMGDNRERIAIFGGSFNPACLHHGCIAQYLTKEFDRTIIIPCGSSREDKNSVRAVSDDDRAIMVGFAFGEMPKVEIDLYDIERHAYTPTYLLQERYAAMYPEAEIWHVVGSDLIKGGKDGLSEIQRIWKNGKELWQNLKFYVITRPGYELDPGDLPPISRTCEIPAIYGSGTMLRDKIARGEDASDLVDGAVLSYIRAHHLYGA